MKNIHHLKIKQKFLNDIRTNKKTFELRRDDRNYKVGDLVSFKIDPRSKASFLYEIIYKLNYTDFPDGLKENYCILGIKQKEKI